VIDVSDATVSGTQAAAFKIRGDFKMVDPDLSWGGTWFVDDLKTVTWTTTGNILNVTLEWRDSIRDWTLLKKSDGSNADGVPNTPNGTSSLVIKVPDAITNTVKIRVRDYGDNTVWDDSDNHGTVKGKIQVNMPNGSSLFKISDNEPITWTVTGSMNTIAIDYRTISTEAWAELDNSIPATTTGNQGTWMWNNLLNTVGFIGDTVQIRVRQEGDATLAVEGVSLEFKTRGKLAVNNPVANDKYISFDPTYQPQTYPITYTVVAGNIGFVKIEYSTNNKVDWAEIPVQSPKAAGGPGVYVINWDVPVTTSPNCYIRVSDNDYPFSQSNAESGKFEIRGKLTVTTPAEDWKVAEKNRTIYWTSAGNIGEVKLQYLRPTGEWATDDTIATLTTTLGENNYPWIAGVADAISSTAKLRIVSSLDKADTSSTNPFTIKADIKVVTPTVVGEILRVTDPYLVGWVITGTVATVNIEVSVDNQPYQLVGTASGGLGSGNYLWPSVSDTISSNVKIRVSDKAVPAGNNPSPQVKIKGKLTVNYPNGGENWGIGQTYLITWTAGGSIPTVKIMYSTDNGDSYPPAQVITTCPSSSGVNVIYWTIPDDVATSNKCRIKVFNPADEFDSKPGWDDSNSQFTIKGYLGVTNPVGNELYSISDPINIAWTKNVGLSEVYIEFSKSGNFDDIITVISPTTAGNIDTRHGSYPWNAPDAISPDCRIRVIDINDPSVLSTTGAFRIKGKVNVTSPGSEQWLVGETNRVITWTKEGTFSLVNIYYTTGTMWAEVQRDVPTGATGGSYTWGGTGVADDVTSGLNAKIKVTAASDEVNTYGESVGFKISGQISVLAPSVSGQIFRVGDTMNIQWSSSASSMKTVRIYYIKGGENFIAEVSSVKGNNIYPWIVTDAAMGTGISIIVKDKNDSTVSGQSVSFYVKPSVKIASPGEASGQIYTVGDPLTLNWVCTGTQPLNINLLYDKNNNDWQYLPAGTGSSGAGTGNGYGNVSGTNWFTFTIPDAMLGPQIRLKIIDPLDVDVVYTTTNTFKVKGAFSNIHLEKDFVTVNEVKVFNNVNIVWTPIGPVSNVFLKYSTDGINFTTDVTTVAVANSGSYVWNIPDDINPSCLIRIFDATDLTVSTTQLASFKIRGEYHVDYPNSATIDPTWRVGDIKPITWTTTGSTGQVFKVNLQWTKGNGSWNTFELAAGGLAEGIDGAGNGQSTRNIKVPDAITSTFRVRVIMYSDPAVYDINDFNMTVRGRIMSIISPAGVTVRVGDSMPITWTVSGSFPTVRLDYWSPAPISNWIEITSTTAATTSGTTGTYTWASIANLIRDDVIVRVMQTNDSEVVLESVPFSIRGKLQVNNPVNNDIYNVYHAIYQNQTYPITYTVTGAIANVKIDYWNGTTWTNITTEARGASGIYRYDWQVPNDIIKNTQIRISDVAYPSDTYDDSTGTFQIRGKINITGPDGGSVWEVGNQTESIYWNAAGSIGTTTLEYYDPKDFQWKAITTTVTSNGLNSYLWSAGVADAISPTAKVRVKPDAILDRADIVESQSFVIKTKITVGKPKLNDILRVWDSDTITYTYTGTVSKVRVSSSVDSQAYQEIGTGMTAGDGTGIYTWVSVSDTISNDVKIKVEDITTSHPPAEGMSGQCKIKGKLILNFPHGDEPLPQLPWSISQIVPITWTAQGSISSVEIRYSNNGGSSYDYVITPSVNSGSGVHAYYWQIPDDVQTSALTRVKVINIADQTVSAESEHNFPIKGYINATYPITGTIKTVNDPLTIQWSKNTGLNLVGLQFSKKGDFSDAENIPFGPAVSHTAGAGTTGSYDWQTPDRISGSARIKIYNWDDPTVSSITGPFRIRGDLTIGSPKAWYEWTVGDNKPITWTMNGSIANVNIYYSLDNFTSVTKTIATDQPASQLKFDWNPVTDDITAGFNVKVKITDASYEEGTQSVSEGFKIKGHLQVDYPPTGEYMVGTVLPITWTATGSVKKIDIKYSLTGGEPYNQVISTSVTSGAGQHSYNWTIPPLASNPNIIIKITDIDDANTTSALSEKFKVRGNIAVASPQNGSVMLVGTEFPISWTTIGVIPKVDIYYSTDFPAYAVWNPIVTSTINANLYTWPNVANAISDKVKTRVVNSDDDTVKGVSAGEAIIRGRFNLDSPNGSNIFTVDTNQPITWTSVGTMPFVKLQYSPSGLFNGDEQVCEDPNGQPANSIDNFGSFTWKIPPVITPKAISDGFTAKVRVSSTTDSNARDDSDSGFKIKGNLRINYPSTAGLELDAGSSVTITWDTIGPIQNVKLMYSVGGGSPITITALTPAGVGSGSYPWTVVTTTAETLTPNIKIKVMDADDDTVSDFSDEFFRIKPKLILNTPNGTEKWIVLDSKVLSWTTIGMIDQVKLEFSTNNFNSTLWSTTLSNVSNGDRYYSWEVLNEISNSCKIRVSSILEPTNSVKNSVDFKIKGELKVTYPDAPERIVAGSYPILTWDTKGTISNVNIKWSSIGDFATPGAYETIYAGVNSGSYSGWTVPLDKITHIDSAKIRVTHAGDAETYDDSNASFRVIGQFTVGQPNGGPPPNFGGNIWIVDENKIISWTNTGNMPYVTLAFSRNGSFTPADFSSGMAEYIANSNLPANWMINNNSYLWKVPNRISASVKVRVYDAQDVGLTVSDDSNDNFKIRGKFDFDSPAGGEAWKVYNPTYQTQTYPISWTTTGTVNNVKIDYSWSITGSFDDAYRADITTMVNTGFYIWQVPDRITPDDRIRIRITDATDDTVYQVSNPIKIRGDFIVNSPAAGVTWLAEDVKPITWITIGEIPNINLELSKKGDWSDTEVITSTIVNSGSFDWAVWDRIVDSDTYPCKIRVLDSRDSEGQNDSNGFKIKGQLTINNPVGGEAWIVDSYYPITWTSRGSVPQVTLEYSQKGDFSDTIQITTRTNTAGLNTYWWKIPNKITYANTVKIRIKHTNDPNTTTIDSNGFKIRGNFIVSQPNGNEIWLAGDTQTISWTNIGTMASVKLYYYYISDPAVLYPIIALSNTGTYSWNIPSAFTHTNGYDIKIMVCDYSDEVLTNDDSNSGFKIRGRIDVLSPKANDAWIVDTTYPITWTTTGTLQPATMVKIEYSLDDFTTMTTVDSSALNDGYYDWKIPDNITNTNVVKVRVRDINEANYVYDDSDSFKIRGNFIVGFPNGNEALPVNSPQVITWTSIGSMPFVEIQFYNGITYETLSASYPNVSGTNYYPWTVRNDISYPGRPVVDEFPFKFRIRDKADSTVTNDESNNGFKIKGGFTVTHINVTTSIYVGVPVTLTWTTEGTVPNVGLEYSMDEFATPKLITNVAIANTGSFIWMAPDDISAGEITKIRVSDSRDPAVAHDESDDPFRIRGWFTIVSPNSQSPKVDLEVGVPYVIQWESFGTMPNITIEWSKTGDFSDVDIIPNPALQNPVLVTTTNIIGVNSYSWTPPDQIMNQYTAKIRVRMTGDAAVNTIATYPFKIKSHIVPGLTVKPAVDPQNINKPRTIPWVVTNETETVSWTYTGSVSYITLRYSTDGFVSDIHTIITNTLNTGAYSWKIPDFGGAGITTTIRAYDANDSDPVLGAYGETGQFLVDYYRVKFNMLDDVTRQHLTTMNVDWDYPGTMGKEYYDSPVTHLYPYGIYTALFNKINFSPIAVSSLLVNKDLEITKYMESSVIHQWNIMAGFDYNPDDDSMVVTSWFERDGLILQGSESVLINIYNPSGTLVKELSSSSPDPNYVFRMVWNNTGLQENTTYWALVELTHGGKLYKSAKTYNITIPVKLKSIANTTSNIEQTTNRTEAGVGRAEAGIGRIESNTTLLLPEKIEQMKNAITALVETQISDMADNINNEIKPFVKSGLVNRPSEIKAGEPINVRFKGSESGLSPLVTVYDDKNKIRVADIVMSEIGNTGEYTYKFETKTSDSGEFTVLVSEPKTHVTDAMVVRVAQALTEDVYDIAIASMNPSQKEDLGGQLSTMENSLTAILGEISNLGSQSEASGSAQEESLGKIYNGLNSLSGGLQNLDTSQAVNFGELIKMSGVSKNSLKDLAEMADRIEKAIKINQDYLKGIGAKFRVDIKYEWGSVIIEIWAINNDTKQAQRIPVRADLPKEVKPGDVIAIFIRDADKEEITMPLNLLPEDVIKQGGLAVSFDSIKNLYYVSYPDPEGLLLESGKWRKFRIEMKDIWNIEEIKLEERRAEAYSLLNRLANTENYKRGENIVINQIEYEIGRIQTQQKKYQSRDASPQDHIFIYRENQERLDSIDAYLETLRKLVVSPVGVVTQAIGTGEGKGGDGGKGEGVDRGIGAITPGSAWKFILIIVTFLGVLSVIFFLIWQAQLKKTRVSPELKFTETDLTPPSEVETKKGGGETET
jgi:hypothetical protein